MNDRMICGVRALRRRTAEGGCRGMLRLKKPPCRFNTVYERKGGPDRVPLKDRKKYTTLQNRQIRQKTPKDFPFIPFFFECRAKASCRALPGSMTVEAALVLPVFLFAMVNLLSLILMFQTFSVQEGKLHQAGRELSLLAYGQESGEQDIRLVKVSAVKSIFPIAAFPSSAIVNGCVMHKWIGYDLSAGDGTNREEGEEMVYITRSGAAYHRIRSCTYLNPSIQLMGISEAQNAVNSEGRRYTACMACGGNSAVVYVTAGGERYHSTVSCSGLKRTIESVTLQEAIAAGRHACPGCG